MHSYTQYLTYAHANVHTDTKTRSQALKTHTSEHADGACNQTHKHTCLHSHMHTATATHTHTHTVKSKQPQQHTHEHTVTGTQPH